MSHYVSHIDARPAGEIPSVRTEGMYHEAMESDSIDVVKAELAHVQAHYESLELMLNLVAQRPDVIINHISDLLFEHNDVDMVDLTAPDLIDLVLRYVSTTVNDAGYENAHMVGNFVMSGFSVPEAFRYIYPSLDFTDKKFDEALDEVANPVANPVAD